MPQHGAVALVETIRLHAGVAVAGLPRSSPMRNIFIGIGEAPPSRPGWSCGDPHRGWEASPEYASAGSRQVQMGGIGMGIGDSRRPSS